MPFPGICSAPGWGGGVGCSEAPGLLRSFLEQPERGRSGGSSRPWGGSSHRIQPWIRSLSPGVTEIWDIWGTPGGICPLCWHWGHLDHPMDHSGAYPRAYPEAYPEVHPTAAGLRTAGIPCPAPTPDPGSFGMAVSHPSELPGLGKLWILFDPRPESLPSSQYPCPVPSIPAQFLLLWREVNVQCFYDTAIFVTTY